jgi:hypothetical protein
VALGLVKLYIKDIEVRKLSVRRPFGKPNCPWSTGAKLASERLPRERFAVPEERRYGVECKNKDCHAPIIFGRYIVTPKPAGESDDSADITPGRLRCSACGLESDYTQQDLRQFPNDTPQPLQNS